MSKISLRSEINRRILELRKKIEYNEKRIVNLTYTNYSRDYISQEINKCTASINSYKKDIEKCEDELETIDNMSMHTVQELERASRKKSSEVNLRKKEQKKKEKVAEQTQRKLYTKPTYRHPNNKGSSSAYFYNRYCNAVDTLPQYMKTNLKTMPNNKGYLWKGCYFFGDLPAEQKISIIFEPAGKGNMIIHEWHKTCQNKYKKQTKSKRVFIDSTPRTCELVPTFSLVDYIKK
jgi:hypothetical protein